VVSYIAYDGCMVLHIVKPAPFCSAAARDRRCRTEWGWHARLTAHLTLATLQSYISQQ